MEWQIPSEPLRSFNSPCSLMPRDLAKSSCFSLSWPARSSRPILRFSSDSTSSRKVRWSRKNMMVLASVTGSSLPRKCSKKIAAMGVTYSWLKRRSVRANPVSPGFTASTPTWSVSRSMWRAKIFSAMVIGRGLVVIGGRKTLPCMRATLKGNRPPYSMTWRVISSSPSRELASAESLRRRGSCRSC